jgi:uncharacterized protein (DUF1501 family)
MTTRRVFLRSSGLALVSFGALPRALARAARAAESSTRRHKTLVVVLQRGACDGLNTVVPYGDGAYARLRPTIAIPAPRGAGVSRETALDLDGFFGLHPALAPLLPLWKDGTLTALHAVGSPDTTRSHFDAQDFMESGTPGRKATEDGWMNRAAQAQPDARSTPFRLVALTPTLPRILSGRAPAVAMASLDAFGLRRAAGRGSVSGFEQMYAGGSHATRPERADPLRDAGAETFEALEFLRRSAPERYPPAAGADYPRGRFGDSLRQIAQLVKAGIGLELAFTEVGGWDHHVAEGGVQGQLAARLRELGRAFAAFHADLGPRLDDVVLVTLTEFGRTARENGNRGTDHGHASVALVMGGSVRGGRVHGRWPGLTAGALHEGRDLALTTDFRDLLGELLARHLGIARLAPVFPGYEPPAARFPGVLRA